MELESMDWFSRENLQETIDFPLKIMGAFRLKISRPIQSIDGSG